MNNINDRDFKMLGYYISFHKKYFSFNCDIKFTTTWDNFNDASVRSAFQIKLKLVKIGCVYNT